MSAKNLVFVVVAHQAYVRHIDNDKNYDFENGILFESISNVYLPLINALRRIDLQSEMSEKSFKISLVLSPTLCEMLSDPTIQVQYVDWLDKKIALGERELIRCKDNAESFENAKEILEKTKKDKYDFTEVYSLDILKEISCLEQKGRIELLGTCGTYAYLPHYSDIPEILSAQIESGLYAHRRFFGTLPNGFYLPYLGYSKGVEKILRSYGMNYSLVDNHGFFFSKDNIKNGIFAPVKCDKFNPLAMFAQDTDCASEIENFSQNGVYKDFSADIGFELSTDDLDSFISQGSARIATGFCYNSKNAKSYNSKNAKEQVLLDAKAFIDSKIKKLSDAEFALKDDVTLVCPISADMLGSKWFEGADFFETTISEILKNQSELKLVGCSDVLENIKKAKKELQEVSLYPCSNIGNGFAENLLDSSNSWIVRYARKMSERMIDIAGRFPNETGLKVRLLNLGARELLLAQSGEWCEMLQENDEEDESVFIDYAKKRFIESIKSFMIVYDSLGSNTVSTEWLTKIEKQHILFPWMNFRIFSKKK